MFLDEKTRLIIRIYLTNLWDTDVNLLGLNSSGIFCLFFDDALRRVNSAAGNQPDLEDLGSGIENGNSGTVTWDTDLSAGTILWSTYISSAVHADTNCFSSTDRHASYLQGCRC